MRLINVDSQMPLLRAPRRLRKSREIIRNVEQELLLLLLYLVIVPPRKFCKAIVGQWTLVTRMKIPVNIYRVARFVTYSWHWLLQDSTVPQIY